LIFWFKFRQRRKPRIVRGFFVAFANWQAALVRRRYPAALAPGEPRTPLWPPFHASRAATLGEEKPMGKLLLTVGFLALAVGLLWIGQGTGAIAWPPSSFMINQIQWAGYGAALAALGLVLIWQGKR
jgi:hypothetical protein